MNSLRLRLILVLAAVVATAMGVVFLYVVPTLRANLIAGRMKTLQQVAHTDPDPAVPVLSRDTGDGPGEPS